jgi:hypothetical protein
MNVGVDVGVSTLSFVKGVGPVRIIKKIKSGRKPPDSLTDQYQDKVKRSKGREKAGLIGYEYQMQSAQQ